MSDICISRSFFILQVHKEGVGGLKERGSYSKDLASKYTVVRGQGLIREVHLIRRLRLFCLIAPKKENEILVITVDNLLPN